MNKKSFVTRILSELLSLTMVLSGMAGISFMAPEPEEVKAATEMVTPLTGVTGTVTKPSSMTGQNISSYYSGNLPTVYFGGVPWTLLPGAASTTDSKGHPQNKSVAGSNWLLWANTTFGTSIGTELLNATNNLKNQFTAAERGAMKTVNVYTNEEAIESTDGDEIRIYNGSGSSATGVYLFPISKTELMGSGWENIGAALRKSRFGRWYGNGAANSAQLAWTRTVSEKEISASEQKYMPYRATVVESYSNGDFARFDYGNYAHDESYSVPLAECALVPALNLNPSKVIWINSPESIWASSTLNTWNAPSTSLTENSTVCTKIKDTEENALSSTLNGKVCKALAGEEYGIPVSGLKTSGHGSKYVSAILYDSAGTPKYYGKVASVNNSDQTVTVKMPENLQAGAKYTLALFEETSYSGNGGSVGQPVYMAINVAYPVNFDANGGTCGTGKKGVFYGEPYGELPIPTRTGYTFDGWYTAKTDGNKITASSTVNITSAQTLYAHWTPNSYTVTFDADGGTCSLANKSVTYDDVYGELPKATRTGYTFTEWYTSRMGGGIKLPLLLK